MLVLTRNSNESLQIGDDIRIIVLLINNNPVRIGIDAPTDVSVHRDEIYRKIQVEKLEDCA